MAHYTTYGNITLPTGAGTGGAVGTINITNGGSGYTTAGYTLASSAATTYTLSGAGSGAYWNSPSTTINPINITATKMDCPEDYDIKLGNVSLKDTLTTINKWLPLLKPNAKLEADFEQLKQLRDQYEALEKELLDKAEMWDLLKKE
jgi:hypothetical protein